MADNEGNYNAAVLIIGTAYPVLQEFDPNHELLSFAHNVREDGFEWSKEVPELLSRFGTPEQKKNGNVSPLAITSAYALELLTAAYEFKSARQPSAKTIDDAAK